MSYKILEENGIDNENIDGGAFNNFAAGNISAVLDGKGLTTSARSHEATGYISYNGKTFIIYGIYSPNSTSVMINCYNAEDHQDTPTGIDSATIKDTVEVLK